ncbi:MAG: hypothetical protein GTN78_01770, partial [Gemmatimonadales bacterium]|nr:hypothetical protein [Gemmatimonadales bacterium]
MHTSDTRPQEHDSHGFPTDRSGLGRLKEHVADYIVVYADGSEERVQIRRRHQIGPFSRNWGENCFQAVAHRKPRPIRPEDGCSAPLGWGISQTRATAADGGPWVNWLYAWENPRPTKAVVALRIEPVCGPVLLFGIAAGKASSHPLRWESRQKAVLRLPKGVEFSPRLDEQGRLSQIQLDMGQVISASRRPIYPDDDWAKTYNNQLPEMSQRDILIEYAAHPDACFHLAEGRTVAVKRLAGSGSPRGISPVLPATQRVLLRVLDKSSGEPVPVKLHLHGA